MRPTSGSEHAAPLRTGGDALRLRAVALAPVLIVGAPRSGTTWLQRVVLAHPACCGGQESHALCSFSRIVEDFDRKIAMPRPHGLGAYLRREELLEALRDLWMRIMVPIVAASPEATCLVEKTPDHAVHLDLAAELFPRLRVIHMVRDARAVVASLLEASRRPWGREWAPRCIGSATARWIECVEAAETAGAALGPDRFLRVRCEDLRSNPSATVAALLRFLTLPAAAGDVQRLVEAAAAGGAAIPLAGALAGTALVEPDGFAGATRPLGWWAGRRVWRRTGALLRGLGYRETGRA